MRTGHSGSLIYGSRCALLRHKHCLKQRPANTPKKTYNMNPLPYCNAYGAPLANIPDETQHLSYTSHPSSSAGDSSIAYHNPPLTSINPSLLSLPYRDPFHTWHTPTAFDNTPSDVLDLRFSEFTHDDLANISKMPMSLEFMAADDSELYPSTILSLDLGIEPSLECTNNPTGVSYPFPPFTNQGDHMIALDGHTEEPWSQYNLNQNTSTADELLSFFDSQTMSSMNLHGGTSYSPEAGYTHTPPSSNSFATSNSSRESRFRCDFASCNKHSQSAKDLKRHKLTHKELSEISSTHSAAPSTHRCICGRETLRSDNHKRHVNLCKAKTLLEETSSNSYKCRCGHLHRDFREHIRHLGDRDHGCGKPRGRPKARGS